MAGNNNYPSKNPLERLKREMKLRNFSNRTVKAYLYYIADLLKFANFYYLLNYGHLQNKKNLHDRD
jgi:hypothetical protein